MSHVHKELRLGSAPLHRPQIRHALFYWPSPHETWSVHHAIKQSIKVVFNAHKGAEIRFCTASFPLQSAWSEAGDGSRYLWRLPEETRLIGSAARIPDSRPEIAPYSLTPSGETGARRRTRIYRTESVVTSVHCGTGPKSHTVQDMK